MGLIPCSSSLLATGVLTLCYIHVQSCPIISGLSKLMLASGNSHHLLETTTMPLPNPSLFVGLWGARTTTVVLEWPCKARIANTQELHKNNSHVVLAIYHEKKNLHHKNYKNIYILCSRKRHMLHRRKVFHTMVKKFLTAMQNYQQTRKRKFCNQEIETVLLQVILLASISLKVCCENSKPPTPYVQNVRLYSHG